ncbi:G-type lectin S-receptor-like serine/threonine-protein kinase RLK1 [Morus notabilis]|uniref:Receptor-like serine/threonine-protein kinase n=1 Tax=Morus notabilis TaxID=981085 RepID=W9SB99_9ROSA|nr:G-type lectin S-receptor-like serine/threonine-protein kinase LECRK2 [Morus notabilis]EXC34488.1 G-type lectin S-receptor-like serine/threonine-protein kinase RLK1 [Morus notabilis]
MALATSYILYFLLCFPMILLLTTAQAQTNISLGSSLIAINNNMSWKSPLGDFAFGFQQIGKDGFLLAIWFSNIPQQTIIWSANRDNLAPMGSKVELTEFGLFLKGPAGDVMWSRGNTGTSVAYAAMLDTGNFVLVDTNLVNLWESFSEPTDTLLPTQTLPQGRKLVARYSEMNYSTGRFFLTMQTDGNLVLYTRKVPLDAANTGYWNSKTLHDGHLLRFNQSGFIYVEAENGTAVEILSSNASSTTDFYHRATLEFDGIFVHYFHPKSSSTSSGGWSMIWYSSTPIPPNICTSLTEVGTGSGACGFNSYCRLGPEQRPNCLCPSGYSFIDSNNEMKGCRQLAEAQNCSGDSHDADNFYFDAMENVDFPYSDYEDFYPMDEDQCRKACLGDCFCVAVIFRRSSCWKLQNPLRNGRADSEGDGGKALIKVRKDYSTTKSEKKHISAVVLVGISVISSSVLLLLLATFLVLFHFKRSARVAQAQHTQSMPGMNLQTFRYEELEKATDGFREQLGRGAFGTVFQGVLSFDKGNLVAVKKLEIMMKEGEQEFEAEVSAIGHTHHKNLVRLIGFCNEAQHRLLVYEYMTKGSLASFIFRPSRPNWHQRTQIALGIARGLFYLHEECSTQIIHCDIKPQNILLDENFTARISDFGLAKILKMDQTRTATGIRGTKGYVAPEWFKNVPITVKVDVYSYGILLLELICCRKSFEADAKDESKMVLADWAYDCYKDGKLYILMENDGEAMSDMKMVEKYVMVSIWCIQEDPSIRPTMKKVIQMLEGSIEVPIPPNPSSILSF